jgi:aminoglycoside phosphotransferase
VKVIEAGRLMFPPGAETARAYAVRNLVSLHGRSARLLANARGARIEGVEREIEDDDQPLHLARSFARGSASEWLMLSDYGSGSRDRIVVFLFDNGLPSTVVKVRRQGSGGKSLAGEAAILRRLRSILDAPLRATLPAVVDYAAPQGHEVLALSALGGQPLAILMQRSLRPQQAHRAHLREAGAWLGRFHSATAAGAESAVHGDFWPRNLLFEGAALCGVIDWEQGEIAGQRWRDLFMLPFHFAVAAPSWLPGGDEVKRFENAFIAPGRASVALASYFDAYGAASGLSRAAMREPFEEWLAANEARGKEGGWESRHPWPAMLRSLRGSNRSVFSG